MKRNFSLYRSKYLFDQNLCFYVPISRLNKKLSEIERFLPMADKGFRHLVAMRMMVEITGQSKRLESWATLGYQ